MVIFNPGYRGGDDFSQWYETFCYHSVGVLNFKKHFMGYETTLLLILKSFCVAVKVCDIHLLNEALGQACPKSGPRAKSSPRSNFIRPAA